MTFERRRRIELDAKTDEVIERLEALIRELDDEHRHHAALVGKRMDDVMKALDRLEEFWLNSIPEQSVKRVRARINDALVGEMVAGHSFKSRVTDRLNEMFSRTALARRYGVSRRCVEDAVYGLVDHTRADDD